MNYEMQLLKEIIKETLIAKPELETIYIPAKNVALLYNINENQILNITAELIQQLDNLNPKSIIKQENEIIITPTALNLLSIPIVKSNKELIVWSSINASYAEIIEQKKETINLNLQLHLDNADVIYMATAMQIIAQRFNMTELLDLPNADPQYIEIRNKAKEIANQIKFQNNINPN